MAAPRLTTLAIKGLVTTPNEYGVYPEGSCKVLENWRAAALNQWTVARDRFQIIQSGVTNDRIKRVVALSPGVFLTIQSDSSGTTWSIYRNGDSANSFTLTSPLSFSSLFEPGGYLTSFVKRSRCFLNSKQGVLVLDDLNPSSAPARVFRSAGLPQPGLSGIVSFTAGDTIPDGVMVTYTALVRRVLSDGYVMTSPPVAPMRIWQSGYSSSREVSYGIRWPVATDYKVGDQFEVYRSSGIGSATRDTDTGTSMRLVASKILDATDITNQGVSVTDRQAMVSPLYETAGAEIYTSPYQDGSLGANLPPPVCKAMAQWGDYTFYGNITDDPSWTYDVPAGTFDSSASGGVITAWVRQYGIGLRRFTGTITAGSATITGVSAADMVGIKVGQLWVTGPSFPYKTAVIAVGATTITMATNATVSQTVGGIADALEINGQQTPIDQISAVVAVGGVDWLNGNASFYPSETLLYTGPSSAFYSTGATILIRPRRNGVYPTLSIRGTNGANYAPAIPDIAASPLVVTAKQRPNFFRWSRQNQPEAVPSSNEGIIGAGAIIRLLATTDCLWALCTDGAYRVSGEAGVWHSDLIDPTFVPVSPDACCVLNDVVYAYTPRGICSLAGVTTSLITRGVLDAEFPGQPFAESPLIHLCANPVTEEIMVIFENATQGGDATMYLYSTLYRQWSTIKFSDPKLTAAASVASSTTGLPNYMVFGAQVSGGPPKTFSWDDQGIALQALRPFPKLTLQPFYAGDPLTLKRWIDTTWLFNNVFQTRMVQSANGYSWEDVADIVQIAENTALDARASLGIRPESAIGPSIRLNGYVVCSASGEAPVLKGLSIRYRPLTTQQKFR